MEWAEIPDMLGTQQLAGLRRDRHVRRQAPAGRRARDRLSSRGRDRGHPRNP